MPISEFTGEILDSRSEEWRHECECRYLLSLPSKFDRLEYIDVRRKRGAASADRLKDDTNKLYHIRKARREALESQTAKTELSTPEENHDSNLANSENSP